MFILGFILFLVGLATGLGWLFWLGIILMILGLVFNFGLPAGPTGTRRRYW